MSNSYVMYRRGNKSNTIQEQQLSILAELNGFQILQQYADFCSTGKKRPEFWRMLEWLSEHSDVGILVTDVSKLIWDTPTLLTFQALMRWGCVSCIITPKRTFKNTVDDLFKLNNSLILSEKETQVRSKHIHSGQKPKMHRDR